MKGFFQSIKDGVVGDAVKHAADQKWEIECMGVSTQRGTGTFWEVDSGKVLHNFVTWQDIRCKKFVDEINGALATKIIRFSRFNSHTTCSLRSV